MSGFTAVKNQGNSGSEGNVQTYAVAVIHSTLLAPGDAVVLTGTANPDSGIAGVDTGNTVTANTGVIVSVDFQLEGENLTETGLPASTAGTMKVDVDPLQLYEIETDATLSITDVGSGVGINVTTATKSGGLTVSNMTLDSATAATGAGSNLLPYTIIALRPGATSEVLGDRALVRPNASTYKPGALGV